MRVLCVVGTRPEAIKMAPVILALRAVADTTVLLSSQHTDLVRDALAWFGIAGDRILDIPQHGGRSLAELTAALLTPLDQAIAEIAPDVVMAQGDTTTVMVAAMAAFYRRVPFAHVEAGLRTGDLDAPFPEEFNRIVAGRVAAWHFCPTEGAAENLRREGLPGEILVTGNTVIDALRLTVERDTRPLPDGRRRILLTAHRRENHGAGLDAICDAVLTLTRDFPDLDVVCPVHPNPEVKQRVEARLGAAPRVTLCAPLPYPDLVREMRAATVILTDSGGIQEEAPYLKRPVLVLRETTERPEAVDLGLARLVGTRTADIVAETRRLLTDRVAYEAMRLGPSPYGDGHAAERIIAALLRRPPALVANRTAA